MLLLNNVTKKYGTFTALADINLEFTGGVYALLAPNGAGKTTLIKMLTTLIFPTCGEILWNGDEIVKLDAAYRDVIGYLPRPSQNRPALRWAGNSTGNSRRGLTYDFIGDTSIITMRNGQTVSGGDFAEMDALLSGGGDEKTLDDWYTSPSLKADCLKNLLLRYENDSSRLASYMQHDTRPVAVRAAENLARTQNENLIRYDLCETFSLYAAVVGVFSILAVILFTAPLVCVDRAGKLNLLQYSSATGRKILKIQFAATLISALALSLLTIAAGYIPVLAAAREYLNAHIMAFDRIMWLYNITFGQYAAILAGMTLALSVGAACFTFLLARYSANMVTLMIKAVPGCAAISAICVIAANLALSDNNIIFNQVFRGRFDAPELIVCGAAAVAGLLAALAVTAREKQEDVT